MTMLTHAQIWRAVDQLAEQHGLSTSRLAKQAGLDSTTFNRSKRITSDGRPRWPSTESIAKVLDATGTSVEQFLGFITPATNTAINPGFADEDGAVDDPLNAVCSPDMNLPRLATVVTPMFAVAESAMPHLMPQLPLVRLGGVTAFSHPGIADAGWDEIAFPDLTDADAYAIEIEDDALLPVYRIGDILVVSPHAAIRRGDRVVVKTVDGGVLVGELARKSARRIELRGFTPTAGDRRIPLHEVAWMARIVWASQ